MFLRIVLLGCLHCLVMSILVFLERENFRLTYYTLQMLHPKFFQIVLWYMASFLLLSIRFFPVTILVLSYFVNFIEFVFMQALCIRVDCFFDYGTYYICSDIFYFEYAYVDISVPRYIPYLRTWLFCFCVDYVYQSVIYENFFSVFGIWCRYY